MRRLFAFAVLTAAALCTGCLNGDDKDGEEEEEYVDSGVFIDIPDQAFRQALVDQGVDYNGDGQISTSEAARFECITIQESDCIRSLEGIEHFTNLTDLIVTGRQEHDPENGIISRLGLLETLDLSHNKKLQRLNCADNRIVTLKIEACTDLRTLSIGGNLLQTLDLRPFKELRSVDSFDNPLTEIVLDTHPALTRLTCYGAALEKIDLRGCPALNTLVLMGPLSQIDLTACWDLRELGLYGTQLETVDLERQRGITSFFCSMNDKLTRIAGLERNTGLFYVSIEDNPLLTGTLAFEGLADLEKISVGNTSVGQVVVRNCASLIGIGCWQNRLTRFEVADCPQLRDVICQENGVETLALDNLPALYQLHCAENRIASLDLTAFPALTVLSCDDNRIAELDLSQSPLLENLSCRKNLFLSLDVSACADEFFVDCRDNEALKTIYCRENQAFDGYYPDGTRIVRK